MTPDEPRSARDAELVAELDWVQRLALSLAKNRDAADDLAQDVARVWLEKRPAHADGPRGWLASVARKLALDRRRSEAARAARERAVARPEREEYEVVERLARQRRVAEAVSELAEPYRSTILYRFLDGLPTSAVAERMHTNEATVRKRIERGLALLRERLEREFGSSSNAWALALLEPALRATVLKGAGIMSVKWIAAAGAVVLVAGLAWYAQSGSSAEKGVGGEGVVVPPEIAAAREKTELAPDTTKLESAADGPRTSAERAAEPALPPEKPHVRGFVFVDDVHTAPDELAIVLEQGNGAVHVDAHAASYRIVDLAGEKPRLWITSPSTIPAQIPLPAELTSKGGVFDLHLSTGRTLALTFLDKDTRTPLPNLAFQLTSSIELERTAGRVHTRSFDGVWRTDGEGKAEIRGVPLTGYIAVRADFQPRERYTLMNDGEPMRTNWPAQPDWYTWLKPQQEKRIEQTVLLRPPLGEAFATGVVPAWAGDPHSMRVVARQASDDPRSVGDPFVLLTDDAGTFELRATAPSRHDVWLQRTSDGEHLSAVTAVEFAQPGAQDPITFRELAGRKLVLRFVHVPDHGLLQALVHGTKSDARSVELPCAGADFVHEFTLGEKETIQLSLRPSSKDKSGWSRNLEPGDEREIVVDLASCERTLRLECAGLDLSASDGALFLMRVESGKASLEQSAVALCKGGRATGSIGIPSGRWLYRYDNPDHPAIWGLVEVTTATQPGEELVLRPRLRLAPVAELEPAIRFDEIEGVSLAKLPEKFRVLSAKGLSGTVALPVDAKSSTLPAK